MKTIFKRTILSLGFVTLVFSFVCVDINTNVQKNHGENEGKMLVDSDPVCPDDDPVWPDGKS